MLSGAQAAVKGGAGAESLESKGELEGLSCAKGAHSPGGGVQEEPMDDVLSSLVSLSLFPSSL